MKLRWIAVALCLLLSGCLRRWIPVADGMRNKVIEIELNSPADNYNAKAPAGFTPAKENRWVLFFYQPAVAPSVHDAFVSLSSDCFMFEVPPDADEKEGKLRHAAVCAHERTPPPPADSEY
ncbi:MAG: hypothetical protein H6Q89_713 [Myxococcaceae bacterium]|nr:hypothetical protein [Myxococcaceae bacterium]